MSCQPHTVASGQSNSGHKLIIHISKLFSHIYIYQSSVKLIYKTNHFTKIKHIYTKQWLEKHWETETGGQTESETKNRTKWGQCRSLVKRSAKLQALVYDILPSTTAVFSCAIGSRKLSANEQFFVGAQTGVSWLQTTQIKQGVSFIAANKAYTSTNKTTIVWIFLSPGMDASHVYVRALALGCFYSHISTRTFRRALTASLDSCAEIKSAPSVA